MNLGQQAMMDTMGQAAKLTGGYGNSNAQMVGQQAYQGYLQGLTDKIPELYQMAQNQYNQQGQDLYQQYGLLNAQDQTAYDRWNSDYSRWLTERDWLSGRYDTERGFDYGTYRDGVGDDQWKAQFDEDIRRFNFENELGEFAPVKKSGSGSSGGSSGSGTRKPANLGVGYDDARYLVEGSTSKDGQEKIIQNAVDKGYVTPSGARELVKLVGNTNYTKK